ncbi:MAG TPA: DeoR/GlpR family DNA-binding transcription regulator [Acidimicrobiales bacterium]|nr:DeoR/GlpR family DNA-binding transcription regulator [Acidimicrobiales bacterium]
MLASQRRRHIADELTRAGAVRVADLAAALGVSEMTVRRDLERMQDAGVLTKVHGGAVPVGRSAEEPGFDAKLARATAEKAAIARAALTVVQPGSSVALSAGTTTWSLARLLPSVPGITVLTNSLSAAAELHRQDPATPVVLSGGVRTPSDALVGPVADASIRSLYVDLLFLGVHGMDPEAGFTTPNLAEAETNRTLVANARRVVVLADSTKWRTVGLSRIAPLDTADVIISDEGLPAEARRVLAEAAELVLVPLGADRALEAG